MKEQGEEMNTGKDILIIDDDRDLVSSIRIVLESKDYNVRAAYNGKEGFGKIEEKPPRPHCFGCYDGYRYRRI